MDLSGVSIVPSEGKVALTFLDDEEGEPETYPQPNEPDPCFLAIVAGVGAKVTGIKKGDTVVVRSWARSAPCIGGNTHVCDAYDVLATLKPD